MEDLTACECPICFVEFDEFRLPMSTPCGHTFCKPCLGGLTDSVHKKGEKVFCCPFCREWVHVDGVHTNVTLRQLIEQIKTLRQGQHNPPQPVGAVAMQQNDLTVNSLFSLKFTDLQLLDSLDSGAYGEVHRGMWKENEVAIKVFHMGRLSSKSTASFKAEFVVMSCMRHPNVVLLMGACEQPRPCIVMEYMRGGSLHSAVHSKSGTMSLENIVMVAQDIGRGLQYLHSINILHRDLKSKNVLLSGELPCQAKICDFGLAKVRQESATMTGNIGTVSWTAPEVLNNVRYHFAADIYSFGMTLFEMVSGEVPFSNMLPIAVVMAVAVRKEKPRIPSDVNQGLKDLINGCIAWDADDRLTILQIFKQLDDILPTSRQPLKRQQSSIDHNERLGVLYLTATSSSIATDSQIRAEEIDSARQPSQSTMDQILANMLQQEEEAERKRLIENDQYLAEQIQQKDYSFEVPRGSRHSEPDIVLPEVVQASRRHASKSGVARSVSEMISKFDGDQGNNPPTRRKFSSPIVKSKPSSTVDPPPAPAPPPVRPVAPSPKLKRPQSKPIDAAQSVPLSRIISMFPRIKLRHVTTVEKIFTPVGRVVEDVVEDVADDEGKNRVMLHPYVQKEIKHFNKAHLKHVVPPKRPSPGHVYQPPYVDPPKRQPFSKKKMATQNNYYPKFNEDEPPPPPIQKKSNLKKSKGLKSSSQTVKPPIRSPGYLNDRYQSKYLDMDGDEDILDSWHPPVAMNSVKKAPKKKTAAVKQPTQSFTKKIAKGFSSILKSEPPRSVSPEILQKKGNLMNHEHLHYYNGKAPPHPAQKEYDSEEAYNSDSSEYGLEDRYI